MQIRSTEEVMNDSYEYAEAILECMLRKKAIDSEIKEIKEDFKERGIAVGAVTKVINELKKKAKADAGELLEQEIIMEKFEAKENILNLIDSLNE